MNKYNWLVSLLIGLPALVLVGAFAVHAVRNRPVLDPSSIAAGASLYEKQDDQDTYKIDISVTSSGIAVFDEAVLKNVQAFEENFRKDLATVEVREDWGQPPTLQVRSTYSAHGDIVSAVLDIYTFTGGAHGMPQVQTLAYNSKTKQMASLDDIFGEADFVQGLSTHVLTDLYARDNLFEESIVREAAGPLAENFDNWSVGEEGVTIYFDPYDVAPFSTGIVHVTIPWETVEQIW
jgi:hypothetical protein